MAETLRPSPQEWRWTFEREIACGGCGARYQVMWARMKRKRYSYATCELCGALMDEWVDTVEKTHLRISDTSAVEIETQGNPVAAPLIASAG